eukprot:10385650-Alexandrium_andersonii.AAC.1
MPAPLRQKGLAIAKDLPRSFLPALERGGLDSAIAKALYEAWSVGVPDGPEGYIDFHGGGNLDARTCAELRALCRTRGLAHSGTKATLIARLSAQPADDHAETWHDWRH